MPSFRCDAPGCVRGVVHVGAFGEPCKICAGQGELTLAELARVLGENEQILARLSKMRRKMRVSTCQRLLGKLMSVIEPRSKPKQPSLFEEA